MPSTRPGTGEVLAPPLLVTLLRRFADFQSTSREMVAGVIGSASDEFGDVAASGRKRRENRAALAMERELPDSLDSVVAMPRDPGLNHTGWSTRHASTERSRPVPAAVRRVVWRRDSGRCAFVGAAGRCRETAFLEFHHVEPYAAGGGATVENIELRCRAHNAYDARLFFGDGVVREGRPQWGIDGMSSSFRVRHDNTDIDALRGANGQTETDPSNSTVVADGSAARKRSGGFPSRDDSSAA